MSKSEGTAFSWRIHKEKLLILSGNYRFLSFNGMRIYKYSRRPYLEMFRNNFAILKCKRNTLWGTSSKYDILSFLEGVCYVNHKEKLLSLGIPAFFLYTQSCFSVLLTSSLSCMSEFLNANLYFHEKEIWQLLQSDNYCWYDLYYC